MEPTKQSAQAMLKEAGGVELAVRTRIVPEHVPFYAWGLAMVILGPVPDFADDSVVGAIFMWLGLAVVLPGALVLFVLDQRQSWGVRVTQRSSNWLIAALVLWVVVATQLLPGLLDDGARFAHTLGGVLAAVPLFVWAERLRRRG